METKVIKMNPISEVNGIKFWRLDLPNMVPCFEPYKVMAYDPNTGMYWFRSLRNKAIISRNHNQLDVHGFHPLCYTNPHKE